jgi:hypothetical protein
VVGVVGRLVVELVELANEIARLGELGEIDLTAPDQVEDELTELGEGILASAVGARAVEPGATFAGAAFDRISDDIGRRSEDRAECATKLRWTEAAPSLACHGGSLTSELP